MASPKPKPEPPPCGRVFDGKECTEQGDHFCESRAQHVVSFFHELLMHTKGTSARKRFILADWQRDEIIRPLFGRVAWSVEHNCYRRLYKVAWIEIARKNGKSELLAGVMLYILLGEGEESAELYGIAKNVKQASLIFDVAAQMVQLNPLMAKRCRIVRYAKRIVRVDTNSFYQVIAADAGAALGSNPSAVAADEILAWPNGDMWSAMRSGMGSMARLEPLMIAATTAGNDTESFGGRMHMEMQRILDDPKRTPHTFVYMRNTPREVDPWDESNWGFANPALGDFLSIEAMRDLALEARNDPLHENSFRQFQLNQWVNSAVRWMPMHLFDDTRGEVYTTAKAARDAFTGREAWFGLDLASRQDLCSWCLVFPDGTGSLDALWRFWIPEAAYDKLNKANSGRLVEWLRQGWLTVTEGDVLDFERFYSDIESDARRFRILGGDADQFSSDPVIQEVGNRTDIHGSDIFAYPNTFKAMSDPMHKIMELVKERRFRWHGNPVARFNFDACEARVAPYDPDLVRPDKPDRAKVAKRIDGVPAAIMAVNAWNTRGNDVMSVYAETDVLTLGG